MMALVRYIAKRNKDRLETIGKEIVEIMPGDLEDEYDDLARIIFPSIMKLMDDKKVDIPVP